MLNNHYDYIQRKGAMNRLYTAKRLLFSPVIFLLASCHHPAHWNDSGTWGHGPGIMGWFGPFGMIIFWIVAIIILVVLVRWIMASSRGIGNNGTKETAHDILKKRYASGDITKEEFERMKRDLKD